MTNPAKHFSYFLLLLVLVVSCKKDKNQDLLTILTSKTWKYSLADKNPSTNGTGVAIPFNVIAECEKDNVFQFKNDGNLLVQSGITKCAPTDPATKTVTYSYNAQTQELILDGIKCTVLELTKDQLKYKAPVPYQTGYVYVMFILE